MSPDKAKRQEWHMRTFARIEDWRTGSVCAERPDMPQTACDAAALPDLPPTVKLGRADVRASGASALDCVCRVLGGTRPQAALSSTGARSKTGPTGIGAVAQQSPVGAGHERGRVSRMTDTVLGLLQEFWGLHGADIQPLGGGMNSQTWLVKHQRWTYVAKRVPTTAVADLVVVLRSPPAWPRRGSSPARQCPQPPESPS
jgi:hypothetical protein